MKKQHPEHSQHYENLSLRISYLRKRSNLSVLELAEKAGISRQHLSNIESPGYYISFSTTTLFNIADALGVSPKDLFDY